MSCESPGVNDVALVAIVVTLAQHRLPQGPISHIS